MPGVTRLSISDFRESHHHLNPELLVEHALVALERYHQSPASFQVHHGESESMAEVVFEAADPRSSGTLEREDFVEKGAIVLAGLLLNRFEKKQITRVARRRDRVDYFVGDRPGDFRYIIEVSGTDERNFRSLRTEKKVQLKESPYRRPPHSKDGFVAVTRFAHAAESCLDPVPAAED